MNLTFDNIIFCLQKAGGISVFWYELLKRVLNDQDIKPKFLDKECNNIFFSNLVIPEDLLMEYPFSFFPTSIQRYLNPNNLKGEGIFHSSYYRTVNNSNYMNVTTVHDFTYEYYRNSIAKFIHSKQKENAIRNSDCIICVSENTKSDLLKFYPEANEKKMRVIYNGVDESYHVLTDNHESDIKENISYFCNEYALYVGDRKSNHKNFALAVNSCVKTETPLVMVGGGDLTEKEKKMLNGLGKSNYMHLSGLSNTKLNILYNYALCLIYPSSYEGFGIPVIEAQKAGCPVLASNKSSIGEIIGPVTTLGNDITLEGLCAMIQRYKTDIEFVNEQVQLGLENSKRFSWDTCYKETKKVYREFYNNYLQ